MTTRPGRRLAPVLMPLLILAHVGVLGLVPGGTAPAHGQGSPLTVATDRVMHLVAGGRLLEATDAVVSAFDTLPPADREPWFAFAARTCISLGSIACGAAVLNQPMVTGFAPDRSDPQTGGSLILLSSWVDAVTGNDDGARRLADSGIPASLATPLSHPLLFAELALLAGQQARRASNFALSRGYLDRALAATLSLQTAPYEARGLVLRIVRQHVANYDAERALRLFAAAGALFEAIPRASLQYAEFLGLRAELHGYRGDLVAASADLVSLLGQLRGLQLAPGAREAMRADAYSQLIALESVRGHHDLAEGFLRLHPLAHRRADIRARGRFAGAPEFWFAVTEEFVHGDGARVGSDGWRTLLEQPVDWATNDDDREQAEAFARAAASLNRLRRGDGGAGAGLLDAAHRRLATLHRLHRQSVYASPLPSWPDRLLMEVAATATVGSRNPDLGLLLGIHLVLSRTLQSRADDTLAALARYSTEDGRRAEQGLYTTDLQRIDWETAAL